ncbi:unnamed protein product, partial [Rotaria sp. Silwood2]
MIAALQSYKSSTYIVQNDKIVYVEGESIAENVVRGYDTIWTYYQEKENGRISPSSLEANVGIIVKCGTFSYAHMPHDFVYIAGVTGTLSTLAKAEKDILQNIYNVNKNTYMPSVFGKCNLDYNPSDTSHVRVMNDIEYIMQIRGEIDRIRNAERAILVFFESEEKLMSFYNSSGLSSFLKEDVQLVTERVSPEERECYIRRATTMGKVTLLTRTFGRGIDFLCSNKHLLAKGGIHVLQTFFSEELSEEVQIKGRTARQGDVGSYRMILLNKDLELVLGSLWDKIVSETVGTQLYETLNSNRNDRYESKCGAKQLAIDDCKKEHEATKHFMNELSSGKIEFVKKFLIERNQGADLESVISRTLLLMDATGSMSSLLSAAKETVYTMFKRASEILEKEGFPTDAFQLQFAVYRNYNCKVNKILEVSSWETKASNLRAFMNTIGPEGGMGEEAIEIGLWYAAKESETEDGISQVILIGDAPANTKSNVISKRKHFGEAYWQTTRFATPTYYEDELQKLKKKNIKVHAFYLTDYAKENFKKISDETGGSLKELNIYCSTGAESLTHLVTKEILRES